MKYRIKIYSQLLTAMASLALTTLCSFFVQSALLSILILILLLVEMLVVTQRPKRLFQRQLNDNFMIVHYPGSKWNAIYQRPNPLVAPFDCHYSYRRVCKSMHSIFSCIRNEQGYFRTITHDTIIRRLEKEAKNDNLIILTCKLAYQKDLSSIFYQSMHKICGGCEKSRTCPHRLASKKKRPFYYIEFYIPEHERSEALPFA